MVAILYRDNCKCTRLLKSEVRGTKRPRALFYKLNTFHVFGVEVGEENTGVFREVFMSATESASTTTTRDYA